MMLTSLCAISASILGGLAIAYTRFVWTHGNGFRRWMRWLAPLWALLAFYYATIWTWDLFNPDVNTVTWLRPAAWAVWLIPAIVLFNALKEDMALKAEHTQDAALIKAKSKEIVGDDNAYLLLELNRYG